MHQQSQGGTTSTSTRTRGSRGSLPAWLALSGLLMLAGLAVAAGTAAAVPTVTIDSPSDLDVIASGTLPIALTVTGFTLECNMGAPNVVDTGHYHLYLDGALQKMDCRTSTHLADVADGLHTLTVELTENDHTELGINDSITITITPGSPRVRILSPFSSTSWASSSVELQIWAENFTFNAGAIGGTSVSGEGHYRVFVDGGYFYYGTTEFFNLTYLTPGRTYQIRVGLHNNDNSTYSPAVYDEITVTIASGAKELNLDFNLFMATVNANSLDVPFTVKNFTIDPAAIGQPAVAGRGHYHAWLDGVFRGPAAENPIGLTDLSVGTHTIVVELRNNDHSVLSPRVVDFTVFTVLAGAPSITVTSPAAASSINSTSIWVDVTVANFTMDGAAIGSPTNVAGVGHYHILIDGNYVTAGAGPRAAVFDLQPGTHTVRAELRNNDHSALGSPAFDEITIAVAPLAPSINITSPLTGSTVALNWTTVTVTVTNFALDPAAIGSSTNVDGRGHYHLFIDGVYRTMAGTTSSALIDLAPGTHVIGVELRNNNHSPLADPVWDEVSVTVTGAKPSIAITAPTTGTIIWGNSTDVTVTILNFTMDAPAIGGASVNGRGHWHVYVDGVYKSATAATTLLLMDLTPGDHWINVSLNNNDHSALGVPQEASVFVHVAKLPSIRISQPASGLETANTSVTITVVVTDFTLDPAKIGQAPLAGTGHYHVFVDNVYVGASGATTFTVTNLTTGNHTISVRPFNNDHTEIPGTQTSTINVRVTSPTTPPPPGFLPGPGAAEVAVSMALAAAVVALVARRRRA